MNKVFIVLFFFLVGCSEPHVKPSLSYKPQGQDESWIITGHMISNLLSHRVTINFNDEQVLEGALDVAGNGSLFGEYNGSKVESNCRGKRMGSVRNNMASVKCVVLIDSEESATLKFN